MSVVTAPQRKLRFLPDQVVTHAEELAYLRGRLRAAVASPTLMIANIHDLQERIEAHLQGLAVAGPYLLKTLSGWLDAEDRDEVFAVASGLLRSGTAAFAQRVLDAFSQASGHRLAGLADALGAVRNPVTVTGLHQLLEAGDPLHASYAALALANVRELGVDHPRLALLLSAPEPGIAVPAWRAACLLDEPGMHPERPYGEGVRHEDPAVREAALVAATWHGEAWVLPALAQLAQRGDLIGWQGLAAWGDERCIPLMQTGLAESIPAPHRMAVAVRWGHPLAIDYVLGCMSNADPLVASAAGEAFARLTGFDVEGRRESVPSAEEADVFAREFADDVWLPDIDKAEAFRAQHEARWRQGARWSSGFDISASISVAAQTRISMQARWDFGARAALGGARIMPPPPAL